MILYGIHLHVYTVYAVHTLLSIVQLYAVNVVVHCMCTICICMHHVFVSPCGTLDMTCCVWKVSSVDSWSTLAGKETSSVHSCTFLLTLYTFLCTQYTLVHFLPTFVNRVYRPVQSYTHNTVCFHTATTHVYMYTLSAIHCTKSCVTL